MAARARCCATAARRFDSYDFRISHSTVTDRRLAVTSGSCRLSRCLVRSLCPAPWASSPAEARPMTPLPVADRELGALRPAHRVPLALVEKRLAVLAERPAAATQAPAAVGSPAPAVAANPTAARAEPAPRRVRPASPPTRIAPVDRRAPSATSRGTAIHRAPVPRSSALARAEQNTELPGTREFSRISSGRQVPR